MSDILNELLAQNKPRIEQALRQVLASYRGCPTQTLLEAMRYSVEIGGKRLRPILLIETARMFGAPFKMAVSSACAVEMIHTYSLIHDDLPCMDNDDLRRGMPACHKKFGEAVALQAGDALQCYAYELVAQDDILDEGKRIALLGTLTRAAGISGIAGGQVRDMELETAPKIIADDLREMYAAKTGSLLRAACCCGALLGDAAEDEIEQIDSYAAHLGLAFQIVDDILDVTGTTQTLGKPVGSDAQEGKTTFVTLLGIEGARQAAYEETQAAIDALYDLPPHDFHEALAKSLLERSV